MSNNPKFTGVWIPKEIFQLDNLSAQAKFVYGIVDSLDNEDGCYASNGYLARSLGLAERQIRNLLKELDDLHLIVRADHNGQRIIRTVEKVALCSILAVSKGGNKLPRGRQKIATGGGNKLPTYNKEDNKEDIDTKDMPVVGDKLPFESKEFTEAWFSWIDYRKEIKKPIKQTTIDMQWKQFISWGEQKSIDSIKTSITNGWTGLFESRNQPNQKQPLTAQDHNNGF